VEHQLIVLYRPYISHISKDAHFGRQVFIPRSMSYHVNVEASLPANADDDGVHYFFLYGNMTMILLLRGCRARSSSNKGAYSSSSMKLSAAAVDLSATVSMILNKYNLSYQRIEELDECYRGVSMSTDHFINCSNAVTEIRPSDFLTGMIELSIMLLIEEVSYDPIANLASFIGYALNSVDDEHRSSLISLTKHQLQVEYSLANANPQQREIIVMSVLPGHTIYLSRLYILAISSSDLNATHGERIIRAGVLQSSSSVNDDSNTSFHFSNLVNISRLAALASSYSIVPAISFDELYQHRLFGNRIICSIDEYYEVDGIGYLEVVDCSTGSRARLQISSMLVDLTNRRYRDHSLTHHQQPARYSCWLSIRLLPNQRIQDLPDDLVYRIETIVCYDTFSSNML
jgi:hypothetical protein